MVTWYQMPDKRFYGHTARLNSLDDVLKTHTTTTKNKKCLILTVVCSIVG